ncbi:hypothetical protein CLV51_104148 [Chitinophaga niastensis]|uniref:Caspase domain-containing protein n=1 Tax=Chitinophaga niastensis TaxID=536980 RepID=A0A2P8HGV7_CHINA|nr:caspase family protein [Chitinophaga niastensis]PSL45446.1 hypothetical protein CLV51_104148 [Chitinophaga niastensis]
MNKCAVIIGVNEVRQLPPLTAAVQGAKDFNVWAVGQGYTTTLITDENGPVTLSAVSEVVSLYVEAEVYDQLLIFFSGHGAWKSVGTELWLLSDATRNAAEAIGLNASAWSAENGNIPHVVFIGDACRTNNSDPLLSRVHGSDIFPNVAGLSIPPEVDRFHAAKVLSPAYERTVRGEDAKSFGLYTRCVLNGLSGNVSEILQPYREDGGRTQILLPRALKTYLEEIVPLEVSKYTSEHTQQPVAHVQSAYPKYLARFRGEDDTEMFPPQTVADKEIPYNREGPRNRSGMEGVFIGGNLERYVDHRLYKTLDSYLDDSRAPFLQLFMDREGGVIIDGTDDVKVKPDWPVGYLFREGKITFVEVPPYYPYSFLLLRLGNGNSVPVTILPEFVAIVLLKDEQVINIRYEPTRNSHRYNEGMERRPVIVEKRALIATAMQFGDFKITGSAPEVIRQAGFIRYDKAFDPTLGLYASYAYAQQGRWEDINSVYEYMSREPEPVLFDVTLLNFLARIRGREKSRFNNQRGAIGPLLTQGWSYFPINFSYFPGKYRTLIRCLVPGLWTTFTEQGARFISKGLR